MAKRLVKSYKRYRTRKQKGGSVPPIIVLQSRWGLGNQIIQYCIACTVQKHFGYKMFILPPIENVHANNKDYRELFTRGEPINEKPASFTDPYVLNKNGEPLKISEIPKNKNIFVELVGHFYEVFKDIMPELAKEMHTTLSKLYPDLPVKNSTQNGFMHVRRGDFITNGWNKGFEFYNSALKIANTMPNMKVKTWHVFSDDIAWCKEQKWDTTVPINFIDESDELKTLAIMSRCIGGAILAQSTFGWAGAVIGAYQHKKSPIIAHIDIINHTGGAKYIGPSDWIYLNNEGKREEYK
jgi:hypothetical protein